MRWRARARIPSCLQSIRARRLYQARCSAGDTYVGEAVVSGCAGWGLFAPAARLVRKITHDHDGTARAMLLFHVDGPHFNLGPVPLCYPLIEFLSDAIGLEASWLYAAVPYGRDQVAFLFTQQRLHLVKSHDGSAEMSRSVVNRRSHTTSGSKARLPTSRKVHFTSAPFAKSPSTPSVIAEGQTAVVLKQLSMPDLPK